MAAAVDGKQRDAMELLDGWHTQQVAANEAELSKARPHSTCPPHLMPHTSCPTAPALPTPHAPHLMPFTVRQTESEPAR